MIYISENFIIDGYNNRTILRDTVKEKILKYSHYSPLRDVMLEANFLSEKPRRATGDGGDENEDWVYNKKTNKYEWDKDVKSSDDIKDKSKYDYVGVKRSDIYKHYKRMHPFLGFFTDPNIDNKSFDMYLFDEIILRITKYVDNWNPFRIDNIRGLKDNIDFENSINKGRYELSFFENNKKTGILVFKFLDLDNIKPIDQVVYSSGDYGEIFPYQLLFYNRNRYTSYRNPQATITIFYNNKSVILRNISKKILERRLKLDVD